MRLALLLLLFVVELPQVAKRGRRRHNPSTSLFAPAPLLFPSLAPVHPLEPKPNHQPAQPLVGLQHIQILHAVPACHVEQDQRREDPRVCPSLAIRPNVKTIRDALGQPARVDQFQVRRQPRQPRQTACPLLRLVLERKHALWHRGFTSSGIELRRQTHSICLYSQDQRGSSIFLTVDLGCSGASRIASRPEPAPSSAGRVGTPLRP